MKLFLLTTCVLIMLPAICFCQGVGIGITAPNTSAALDITNTSKGLLIPRMTMTGINAVSNPARGLMVYDSGNNQLMVNMGTASIPNWKSIVANSGWGLQGNSGTNPVTNFIGTTDDQPLRFKVNNQWAGEIDSVNLSTFLGYGSGKTNAGYFNSAYGYGTLNANTSGASNTAFGFNALDSNNTGSYNTASGFVSLSFNSTGRFNTASGAYSMAYNLSGSNNTATGNEALYNNNTGDNNTATGSGALNFNNTGNGNTATGNGALLYNNYGNYNVANGYNALYNNRTGGYNTAIGTDALYYNAGTEAYYNTAVGHAALYNTTNSQFNTAIGYYAGEKFDNGYNNVFVGANTDVNGAGYYNVIAIGQGTVCTSSSQVTIGNGATGSYRTYANWSNISDGRYKKNVQENVPGLDFINRLRPVTYNLNAISLDAFLHKNDKKAKQRTGNKTQQADESEGNVYNKALREKEQIIQTGFVAQEVEATAKTLGFNFSGIDAPKNEDDVYGLRYAEFVVPLVKAVQELNAKVETLVIENAQLKAAAATAGLQDIQSTVKKQQMIIEDLQQRLLLLENKSAH